MIRPFGKTNRSLAHPSSRTYNYVRRNSRDPRSSDGIEVDPRIGRRHPELSNDDVSSAWRNALVVVERSTTTHPDTMLVAVGFDAKGRLLEMVGIVLENERVHVFHAMTPPSKKTLRETGMDRWKR